MANPQKDDGNTGINNRVLEQIYRSGLNGTELAIILMIIRKTWGFNKKTDSISLSQFLEDIPVSKQSLINALNNLQLVKIIRLVKKGNSKNSCNQWTFNKDYDTWQLVKKSRLVKFSKSTSKENLTHNINNTKKNKIVSEDTTKKIDYSVLGFSKDGISSFKEIRRKTKAVNTQRSINSIGNKFKKAFEVGYTENQILDAMHDGSWKGFEAAWMQNKGIKPENNKITRGHFSGQSGIDQLPITDQLEWARRVLTSGK